MSVLADQAIPTIAGDVLPMSHVLQAYRCERGMS
jgi:hypothetical protein